MLWQFSRKAILLVAAPCICQFHLCSLASSPESTHSLAAGPPFTIERRGDAWWLGSPQGKPFFSQGVCAVSPGTARSSFDPDNPGYAAWQHYASPDLWAQEVLHRLTAWR